MKSEQDPRADVRQQPPAMPILPPTTTRTAFRT
jgi:hypothetical protein